MLQNIGLPGLILILVLVVFLFGSKKLPELSEAVAKSVKKFKDVQKEVEDESKKISDNENKESSDKGNS